MDNLAILAKNKVTDARRQDIQSKIDDCIAKVKPFLRWQIDDPEYFVGPGEALREDLAEDVPLHNDIIIFHPLHLLQKLDSVGLGQYALHFALKKELKRYTTYIKLWQMHFSRRQERQAAARFAKMQSSIGTMCKVLKGTNAAPLSRIKGASGSESKTGATITTDPMAIDKQLQAIWGKIHAGNMGPATQECSGHAFLNQYGAFFVKQAEFKVSRLSVKHLKDAIHCSPDNSPGLDGVLATDLEMLSDAALQRLADMLNLIEDGADWPQQMLAGRMAWLDKTDGPEPSLDPLDYRGLAILSKVYRLYGVIRLRHINEWIKTWEKHELFAGTTAPSGAEDAWYLMGLDLEVSKLYGQDITGGSADIWKCFDQVQRKLLYFLLEAGGFPMPILKAYMSFHEQVHYHNTIGGALGAPHRKPCSIPQGCPFSMMMTSFSFHPWVALMKSMYVILRGLADDLTVVATGPGHERRFRDAYSVSILPFPTWSQTSSEQMLHVQLLLGHSLQAC